MRAHYDRDLIQYLLAVLLCTIGSVVIFHRNYLVPASDPRHDCHYISDGVGTQQVENSVSNKYLLVDSFWEQLSAGIDGVVSYIQFAAVLDRTAVLPFYSETSYSSFSHFHAEVPSDKKFSFLEIFSETSLSNLFEFIPDLTLEKDSSFGYSIKEQCNWIDIDFSGDNSFDKPMWKDGTLHLPRNIDLEPGALKDLLDIHDVICIKEFRGFCSGCSFRSTWSHISPTGCTLGNAISCFDFQEDTLEKAREYVKGWHPFSAATLRLEKIVSPIMELQASDKVKNFKLEVCMNAISWVIYELSQATGQDLVLFHDIQRSRTFNFGMKESLSLLETIKTFPGTIRIASCPGQIPSCSLFHLAVAYQTQMLISIGTSSFHTSMGMTVMRKNGTFVNLGDICSSSSQSYIIPGAHKKVPATMRFKPEKYQQEVANFCDITTKPGKKPHWLKSFHSDKKKHFNSTFGPQIASQLLSPERNDECVALNSSSSFCFPSVFLLGPMKTGTTTIFSVLKKHPDVAKSVKETYFFEQASQGMTYEDERMARLGTFDSYKGQMDIDEAGMLGGKLFVDGTALLFSGCEAETHDLPQFLRVLSPKAKLMYGTRGRAHAISSLHRYSSSAAETNPAGLHSKISSDIEKMLKCLASNDWDWEMRCIRPPGRLWCSTSVSMYFEEIHLSSWMRNFPRENFLQLKVSEGGMAKAWSDIKEFLGLSDQIDKTLDWEKGENVNSAAPPFELLENSTQLLKQVFLPFYFIKDIVSQWPICSIPNPMPIYQDLCWSHFNESCPAVPEEVQTIL